jgi:hypothetical protein
MLRQLSTFHLALKEYFPVMGSATQGCLITTSQFSRKFVSLTRALKYQLSNLLLWFGSSGFVAIFQMDDYILL